MTTAAMVVRWLFALMCFSKMMTFCRAHAGETETVHTKTFRSPGFTLGPGDVIDRYLPVAMPKGHIAVRSLDMTLVDSVGNQIPLSETYLHHWVLIRYYIDPSSTGNVGIETVPVANNGVCNPFLVQWFGHGSEFRHTHTTVPAPYGIVLGNPDDVPEGLVEVWFLNVHAIDTRGVVDPRGCTECLCDVYNVSVDGYGKDLPPGYEGGMFCCHDETQCPLQLGFEDVRRELFLEFTITFVDFSDAVVPVKLYLLDVTDQRTAWDQPPQCQVEYTVPKCTVGSRECTHKQEAVAFLPEGGYVVVSSAHLHNGGIVASVSLENRDEICVSHPIYGQGSGAGNETGYIVGMTSCYPDPKSIYIRAREKLHLKAVYNNEERHTGVMGILLLVIAEGPAPPSEVGGSIVVKAFSMILLGLAVLGAAAVGGGMLHRWREKRSERFRYSPIDI
ncbi:unnamed protein product [Calypogeia fissa]